MRKSLISISIIFVGVLGLFVAAGWVQAAPPEPPPDIEIYVSVDRPPTAAYYPGDPIMVSLSVANVGADEMMRKGWKTMEFWLLLQFYDEKGRLITSDKILESTTITPPPPRIFPDENGVLIQGTLVELIAGAGVWFVSFDPFDAYTYYPLQGKSGLIRVKAVFPGITFKPDKIKQTPAGIKYAPRYPIDTTKWFGDLQSAYASFTLVGDEDGDNYFYPLAHGAHAEVDCDDDDPAVNPGATEIPNNGKDDNCDGISEMAVVEPANIEIRFDLHTVGTGSKPGSTKEPCVEAQVAAFDKFSDCVSNLNFSFQNYQDMWTTCPQVGFGEIDGSGKCVLQVPAGHYYIIGLYDPNGSAYEQPRVYDEDEVFCGVSAGSCASGQTMTKYMQVIIKADKKKIPAKSKKLTGSELLIIEPEYVEWDGTEELYPFIFESIGDWDVNTSVAPPEGFVADNKSLSEEVNTELEAVQFTLTDLGTKWNEPTEITYDIKHKKKKYKVKSKVHQKLKKEKAKKLGLDIWGNKIKKKK